MLKVLTLLIALAAPAPGFADDTLDRIRARGVLVVSVKNPGAESQSGHKDPAHFPKRAFEVALAHAIAARVLSDPDKLELRSMRKPERLAAVADGSVDLGISMLHITPEAERQVDFSTPYFESGLALLQSPDGTVATWSDLAGKRLARIRHNDHDGGEAIPTTTFAQGQEPTVVEFAGFADAAAAIAERKVDGLLSEAVNLDAYLARHPGDLKRSPLLTHERCGVAVAKGNAALLALVNQTIESLRQSGELAAMLERAGLRR